MSEPALVLLAAGASTRMGGGIKKEYLPLEGGTVLSQAATAFLQAASFSAIAVAIPPQGGEDAARHALLAQPGMDSLLAHTRLLFVPGGATRQESVRNALHALSQQGGLPPDAIVLIHDAARPFVTPRVITDVLAEARKHGAAVPGVPPVDTQKELAAGGTIARHLRRSRLAAVQTPQGFRLGALLDCHSRAAEQGGEYTDDSEIWDAFPQCTGGQKVRVVPGEPGNRKITFTQDVPVPRPREPAQAGIRVGMGTDLHRLVAGRRFVLGGVEIPAEYGELGHSDGDALLHAITDALLGAAGLGDIGSYFPPDDPQWKGADSAALLRSAWADVRQAGWRLGNLDCVVECERPKLLPWREQVISSIATILEAEPGRVFVKAKTNEGLDAVGSGGAVKAYCVCLLCRV